MTTYMESMFPAVSLPRFTSSKGSAPQSTTNWNSDANAGVDQLDFDLLAEYLLDEGSSSEAGGDVLGLSAFDFNIESANQSGVVSPEQSDDGMPQIGASEPKQASGVVQVQNIIAAHAAAQGNSIPTLAPAPSGQPSYGRPGVPMAPAPSMGGYSKLAAPGPAPIAAAPPVVLHQHAAASTAQGNKRRRTDVPMMAISGGNVVNGQFMSHAIPGRGRQKSQAQIDRRRERNRILARRTRLRKKFFFESLQKDVIEMQRENAALKEIAKTKLDPETSKKLLAECNAMEQLPSAVLEACGENASDMDSQDYSLVKSIQNSQQCFVITDPSLQDNPIVYASDDFLELTGYSREEVLGRNCRFLQGTETSASKVEQVSKAVANGEDVSVTLINYKADGTAFWNKLFIAALRDAQNNIVNFIGVTVKVASPEPGDPEAGKRLPGEQEEDAEDAGEAEATVKAIEGAVSAAVAGVPGPFFS